MIHCKWLHINTSLLLGLIFSFGILSKVNAQNTITIIPTESQEAFRNPLKGFRGGEYGTLRKDYIKWNLIENDVSDGVQKIRDVCNSRWKNDPGNNGKIIPRVYLEYSGSNWPADMKTGDYTSQQFQDRLVRLVARLGEVWDNDPRVAYVEMGIFGNWGEQETPAPTPAIQKIAGDAFKAAFKNKLVMVRHNWDMFQGYPFGCYWDSWAHWGQQNHYRGIASTGPRWKIAPVGGEAAYNWGDLSIQPGQNPDATLSDPAHRNYLLKSIRELHGNHLGWVSNYSRTNPSVSAGAKIIQKVYGHRFVIKQVTYPRQLTPGQAFDVSFSVVNTGSSPFYTKWPVEVSLLDKTTKQPVYQRLFGNVDVTQWMPGDAWDDISQTYKTPAAVYDAKGRFNLPSTLPAGQYILALAMLDPGGLKPSNRFAINNYFTGGRHPMGYVGVGQDVAGSTTIDPASFNSLVTDNTLKYDIVATPTFTLTLKGAGAVSGQGVDILSFYPGSSVTITAKAGQAPSAIKFTGDIEGDPTQNTMTITMDKSKTLSGNFEILSTTRINSKVPSNNNGVSFSTAGHGSVFISQLSGIHNVAVYELSGKLVRTMDVNGNQIFWDGMNSNGQMVKRGVYIVQFQGNGNSHSIRVNITQ